MIGRLDFTRPPSGFAGSRCGSYVRIGSGDHVHYSLDGAWRYHETHFDPPGCALHERAEPSGFSWSTPRGELRDAGMPCSKERARAKAWAWYRDCVKLDAELRVIDEGRPHTLALLQAVEWWPDCLSWPPGYAPAIRKWLADGEGIPPGLGFERLSPSTAKLIAEAALMLFFLRCEDEGRAVPANESGAREMVLAVLQVLHRLEPSRWEVKVSVSSREPHLTVRERGAS